MSDIAWVEEGGGAKGAFGVGVMRALEDILGEKLNFGAIAGSSVGGLNGVMIAAGETDRLVEIWRGISSHQIFCFKPFSSIKKKALYSTEPLRRLLEENLTEEIFQKLKDKKVFITGLNFRTNRLVVYQNFPDRAHLINALMVTSAIPGTFEVQLNQKGEMLVDGGLFYPLPYKVLIENGFRKILAIIHEPLILEEWTGCPRLIEEKGAENLKDFLNRLTELITRNLTKKDLEKYYLAKCFEQELKNFQEKICLLVKDSGVREEIIRELERISFPYRAEMIIFAPPVEIHGVLDFSRTSIQKAIDLGYNVGMAKIEKIKKFFEE